MANKEIKHSTVLIGERYYELYSNEFGQLNIDIIPIPDNPELDAKLSGHVDMSVLKISSKVYFAAKYLENSTFEEYSKKHGISVHYVDFTDTGKYPNDCRLNVLILGKNAVFNPKCIADDLLDYLRENDYTLITVSQGYTKCSTAVISDNAVITADTGIYHKLTEHGIDTLLIQPGYFRLEGFEYGFIGGSATSLDNKIMFTGAINQHPDQYRILDFIDKYNKIPHFLSNDSAEDIGGMIEI